MSESLLLKQFREKDVQRIRNLISKKFNDKTQIQIGYDILELKHKEGEIWYEDGKKWIIINGIKQSISKYESLRKSLYPLFCPECNKIMKHSYDKRMYILHRKCFNCVVVYETKLKRLGKYEEYEKNIIKNNKLAFLKDLEQGFNDFIEELSKEKFITEDGVVEEWEGGNFNIENLKKETEKYISESREVLDKE